MEKIEKLSWTKSDIENICGFRGGKFTRVNFFFTMIIGILMTAGFYLILLPFRGKGLQMVEMFFHGGVENRSVIPYFTVFLACFSFAILLVKNAKLKVQRKALQVNILPQDTNFALTPVTAREMLDNMYLKVDQPNKFILFDRVERAISNLKNLGSVSAVAECLKNQADNDDSCLSSSYTVLKGFIWAIPVLGFIGTVIGLAEAVGGFGTVVAQGADIEMLKSSLGGVTSGLAIAFETTLIALVLALLVQLYMTFILSKEEIFLSDCADYCHRNIISKMRTINFQDEE
ncbi:MAG: MotA/TolQ/ExbB proton channel family protein [Lentisphaeria bacterium]|nr:MotA/TolQ/ExbB proton channel family protein [Lentisphaeria bacterium]